MEKREHSVPDDAPSVEIPDDNEKDDLRDADELEKLGESLPPGGGDDG
jgi:archaellum component FlaC